jgi:hypothetical protein
MRFIILCALAWSLCSIAAAQTPDPLAPVDTAGVNDSIDAAVAADSVPAATAAPLSGTLYMCRFGADSPLYTVNPTTGAAKSIGSMDLNQICTDLAFRKTAASGTQLFGTSFTRMYSINPATGKAKLLSSAYGAAIADINALVAQPGSGVMYGAGSTAPGEFIEISPTTGKATKKGNLGKGISSAGDLEFLKGQLYGLVNKSSTGTETYLAKISLGAKTMGEASSLLLIRRLEGSKYVALDNVWGLGNRNGILYVTMNNGDVLTLNPATGIATYKGDNKIEQAGLAVAP